ncbi:MAG: alanine--tRNA ligase-related protein, partial [Candidatus Dojkabacteria bacterium]
VQDKYDINDDSGRFIEIGNNVFMQNKLDANLKWQTLPQKNIDFGGGFERVVMIAQGKTDIYETDIYQPIIKSIEGVSGKNYKSTDLSSRAESRDNEFTAAFRVIADHGRAAAFILADGVTPSNKDQGYILRRFIRRLVRFGKKLGIEEDFTSEVAEVVIETMGYAYPHLETNREAILEKIEKEEKVFKQTLNKGLKFVETFKGKGISGAEAFNLYETYGFPLELTLDELKIDEKTAEKITEDFKSEEKKHRENSRAGAEQKFKGGLADSSRETTKLHTAHHLLLSALQRIVNPNIKQRGSNITAERLRLDFNLDRKLSDEELKEVEDLVNKKIEEELPVTRQMMNKEQAEKIGAQMEFGQKYGDVVSVYLMGKGDEYFSKEFCGGPHVENTKELGEGGKEFKIIKEESSGSGIRRIKAALV